MNSNCDKMQERVAELITGSLPDAEREAFEQHLDKCTVCRDYAQAFQTEERMLSAFFAGFDAEMKGREDKVVEAVQDIGMAKQGLISVWSRGISSSLGRHAVAAGVIIAVAIYFTITLTWISQITECISYCM